MTLAGTSAIPLSEWRRTLPLVADGLAAAVAASLPWSTSAASILLAVWLAATLPLLDVSALRRELASAAGGLPVVFAVFAVAGMAWSDASLSERLQGMAPFLRLLAIPILLAQFRCSPRGQWVGIGFLLSATTLLATSFAMVALGIQHGGSRGVPVKDYISQSGAFVLCGFALIDYALDRLREGRRRLASGAAILAVMFFADVAYIVTSRTTLIVIPLLFVILGLHRFSGKRLASYLLVVLLGGAAVWVAAPQVGERLLEIPTEIASARATGAFTSSGARLIFWHESLVLLGEAPLVGHGTGSLKQSFRGLSGDGAGPSATNPHNEIFAVGIQLGGIGIFILLAMWSAHLHLFLRPGALAWVGLAAVMQNIVGSLFNSHLMDFTQSWLYVFAVGAYGGMLRQAGPLAPAMRVPAWTSRLSRAFALVAAPMRSAAYTAHFSREAAANELPGGQSRSAAASNDGSIRQWPSQ